MKVMQKIIVYTKLNCQLCDEAYHLLIDIACDIPLRIEVIDINQPHNQTLSDTYRERIPVVAKPETPTELNWPFTSEDLRLYLTG
jgi:hypothetical protein